MDKAAYLDLLDKSAWGGMIKLGLQMHLEQRPTIRARFIASSLSRAASAMDASRGSAYLVLLDRYAAECGPVGCRR